MIPPHDHGAVAVIDGTIVNITPFRTSNVPPPMSSFQLHCESNVVDVAFGKTHTTVAILHQKGLDIYLWQVKDNRSLYPRLACRRELPKFDNSSRIELPLQICAAGPDEFAVSVLGRTSVAIPVKFSEADQNIHWRKPIALSSGKPALSHVTISADGRHLSPCYVQDESGKLFELLNGSLVPLTLRFPTHLPWWEITFIQGRALACGLARNGTLYANSRMLSKNCTSFLVTPSHLVFTTNNHFVKFVHLSHADGK
jgi:elongator complex protein 1